ncbi:DUF2017 family protein [Demequina capsici]|uniref:DUF2017 family protein n=1 Tax=Demequina capsici TaxID=3075620 RepID=A0AA96FD56_9MICO|nr:MULTISPECIES: DUF2017 family protein [unclassified Demequina]WNM25221.1 DUF2017 family protein [Demequina sp. OYTSA14]WNM28134.1 DUF2017 family protein [Demequina sp. PMTSA13]
MRGFERQGDTVVAVLDEEERTVIARIIADVGLLLGDVRFGAQDDEDDDEPDDEKALFDGLADLGGVRTQPVDPAVLRLLPDASPADAEVSAEFRRLTEGDLRALKLDRLRRMWDQLGADGDAWVLKVDEAMPTAAAFTDVRLVLATRLGLDTDEDVDRLHQEIDEGVRALDEDEDAPVDHERVWLGMLYQALSWLQETLVGCLAAGQEDDV